MGGLSNDFSPKDWQTDLTQRRKVAKKKSDYFASWRLCTFALK
jgi:hypothetical protein